MDLQPEQYQTIQELGLKFRGANNWLYFFSYHIGKLPQQLNAQEVELLVVIYKKLLRALKEIQAQSLQLSHHYLETFVVGEKKKGVDEVTISVIAADCVYPFAEYEEISPKIFNDDSLIQELKKCPRLEDGLELTYFYSGFTKDEETYSIGLVTASKRLNMVASFEVIDGVDQLEATIFDFLVTFIKECGIPARIHVRLKALVELLLDFCDQLDIALLHDSELEVSESIREFFPE